MRIDGWASMDHRDDGRAGSNGTLTTAPFVAPRGRFEVWANLRAPLNASLVGLELRWGGAVGATSALARGVDAPRRKMISFDPADFRAPNRLAAAKMLQLRFTVARASIYSWWIDYYVE